MDGGRHVSVVTEGLRFSVLRPATRAVLRAELSKGEHMRKRYRYLLLAAIVLLWAVAGIAGRAFAVTFTESPIPTAVSNSGFMTKGPDGAVWFTETQTSKIGRISPAGVFTEFSLPTNVPGFFGNGLQAPYGITVGPDGALWFVAAATNQIGRITTDGVITEFTIPVQTCLLPFYIMAGPDGALWFTQGVAIWRITTNGVMTEFPIGAAVGAVTAGPDGALWFT